MRCLALAVLVVPLLAPQGAAQLLQPGRLLVASEGDGTVHVFGPGGNHVDSFAGAGFLGSPGDMAFGPDGRLYAASPDTHEVVVFDADGSPVDSFPLAVDSSADSLAFGPDGVLWVLDETNSQCERFDLAGVPLSSVPVPGGTYPGAALAFGADGRLLLSNQLTDSVLELDAATGAVIRELGDGQLVSPRGLVISPHGRLYVCQATDVVLLDAEGEVAETIDDAAFEDLRALVVGPNGKLYAVDAGADVVHEITHAAVTGSLGGATLTTPSCGAFVPYRFKATVKGHIAQFGHELGKVKETSAVLTLLPGSRTMMLALTDDITEDSDLASVFGATCLVFRGFESGADDEAKVRMWEGAQVGGPVGSAGVASLALQVNGQFEQGQLVPKKAKGTLHRAGELGVYTATVKAGKLLP